MKVKLRFKSFPDHQGIPGHQGGSLPKKSSAVKEQCIICGKDIRGKPIWFVHMTTANKVVPIDYEGGDSQGAFPIGSECAKKYKGLAWKNTNISMKSFEGHKGIPGHQGGSLPRNAADVDKYKVEIPVGAKNIDFSSTNTFIVNNDNIDNSDMPPLNIGGGIKRIIRANDTDLDVMKQIANNEKEFYDNPNSTGQDNHIEVRLLKYSWGYGIYYTSFHLDENGEVFDKISWVDDFGRCPTCKFPTIYPNDEQAYHSCSTCNREYIFEGEN